jgi:hypothetical protein
MVTSIPRMFYSALAAAAVLAGCAAWASQAEGECHAPRYKIAGARATAEQPEVNLSVSIDPKSVSLGNLYALACQFRSDFSKADVIRIDIFNDFGAAKRDDPLPGGDPPSSRRDDSPKYIASYYFGRSKREEHLLLLGDVRGCTGNIIIDLLTKHPRSMCDY